MKGTRNELALSTLGRYLKRRQYSDSEAFKKSDLKLHQSLQEMALQGMVQAHSGVQNAVIFSSVSGDAANIVHQYTRLKSFISEASEPYRSQLSYLLYPMFIQLYLELISSGHKMAAQKFYADHHNLFVQTEHYKHVVEILPKVLTMQDLSTQSEVKEFRETKCTIHLTEDCLEYFIRYLKNTEHIILLQLLNLYFDIEVHSQDQNNRLHLYEDNSLCIEKSPHKASSCHPCKTEKLSSSTASTEALTSLKQAIKKIGEGPPCLPSVCFYTISDAYQGLSRVALSVDNSLLAGAFEDSTIRLWSLTPELLESEPTVVDVSKIHLACDVLMVQENINSNSSPSSMKVLRGHGGPVYGLSFTPQNELLLSCSEDTTVRAWSMKTHTNVALYTGHAYPVWDIDVSSLGLYFATASKDHTARLWTTDRTYPLRILAGHNLDVDCVKFHPNCNYVATGSSDRTVRLWNVQDGRMVRMFVGHRGSVYSLAFSPNGQYLASAGEDRRIKIWDLGSGSQVKELRGHTDMVYSLCFNGDSSVLASGGLEHAIRIWDVRRGVSHIAHPPTTTGSPTGNAGIEGHTSPELLAAFPTKSTPLHLVHYTWKNLLMAVGVTGTSAIT